MRIPILAVLAAPFVLALVPTAHASTITDDFLVIANDANTGGRVFVSYEVTFDPTRSYTDATAGIRTLSVTPFGDAINYEAGFAATPAFDYDPKYSNILIIGGLLNGANELTPSTNDFLFGINHLLTVPTLGGFYVSSTTNRYSAEKYSGTITVTKSVSTAVTPEPSSFILLGTGLLGIIGTARRRMIA